jgi:hypothetical protein
MKPYHQGLLLQPTFGKAVGSSPYHQVEGNQDRVKSLASGDQQLIDKALGSGWFIRSAARAAAKNGPNRDDAKRCEAALGIWRSSTPAGATLVPAGGEHRVVASENEGARHDR